MKKLLFAAFFIVSCFVKSQAQHEYSPYITSAEHLRWEIEHHKKYSDSIIRNNISSATIYRKYYDKKGMLVRSVVYREMTFDKKGDLATEIRYDRKGRLQFTYKYEYAANGIQSGFARYDANGKFLRGWKVSFNGLGMPAKITNYWKREDKISWAQEYTYNADSNLIKATSFDSKGAASYYVERDYYSDGQLKETRNYNKKGKLISVLKYDCTPTGTLGNRREADTTTICTKSMYDADSNKIYTREIIKQNGKIWRSISKVNKAGQLIEVKSVDHKGRDTYTLKYSYNANGKVAEETFTTRRGKSQGYIERYEYSSQGQRIKVQSFTHKNQLQLETCTLTR